MNTFFLSTLQSQARPESAGQPQARTADDPASAPLIYQSYLLRLWRETPQGVWRAVLEDVRTNERHAFARLSELVKFLEGAEPHGPGRPEAPAAPLPARVVVDS